MSISTTTEVTARELDELLREIERYLAAVELFRREGHEPRWTCHEKWTA